jgi:hypothetical protein
MDLGLLVGHGRWQGGVAVANLGPEFSFDGTSAPLPRHVRAGVALQIKPEVLLVAFDIHDPSDFQASYRGGVEWRLHQRLTLRSGYRLEPAAQADTAIEGASFGFTAPLGQLALDYAYVAVGPMDPTHRIGLIYKFNVKSTPTVIPTGDE